jgi:YVTN family beta-propeller protein
MKKYYLAIGTFVCLIGISGCVSTGVQPDALADSQPDGAPQLVKKIRVGYNPVGSVMTAEGKYVYVANSTSNSVSKIDTSTLNVVSTIQMDGSPVWIAICEPAEKVCVTAREGRSLSLIDQKGNYLSATIDLPHVPEKVVVHPTRKIAYVGSGEASYIMVVDLERKRIVKNIITSSECIGLAITPDGKFVYVSTRADRYNLQIISTEDQSVVTRKDVGSNPSAIAMGPKGEYAYVANRGSDDVTVIHVPDHHPVLTFSVGPGPVDLAVTPSGKYLYVSCQLDNAVVIVDTKTNQVVHRIDLEVVPWGLAFSPDGLRVFVANYKSKSAGRSVHSSSPNTTLGTGSGDRVNNNMVYVFNTNKYH